MIHPRFTVALAALFLIPVALLRAQDTAESDGLALLREEVKALRLELARAQLQLNETLAELEEVRDFVASEHTEEQLKLWRRERASLTRQRQLLAEERQQLELARRSLRESARLQTRQLERQLEGAVSDAAAASKPKPQIDYQIAVIPTGDQAEIIYIDPEIGEVLLERHPNIDQKNIMVRGTLQNRSTQAWRYTFEIRIADRAGLIIGRWRYQTPRLEANGLHPFEVKVPVSNVGLIQRYQIGNIEADQPVAAGR